MAEAVGLLLLVCLWLLIAAGLVMATCYRSRPRTVRSVREDTQRADRAVQDIARHAQADILRLVLEARMRDRYSR